MALSNGAINKIEVLTDRSNLLDRPLVCFIFTVLTRWSRNNAVDAALKCFLLQEKAVLVPNKVRYFGVKLVSLHAALEQTVDVLVVGVGRECKAAAVIHVLLEFRWLVEAEFVDRDLLLLALDVVIFFVLGAAGESLPWE